MNCKYLAHYASGLPRRFFDICKEIVPCESRLTVILKDFYHGTIIEEYISFNCWEEICSEINKMSGEALLENILSSEDGSINLYGYRFSPISGVQIK